MTLFFGFTIIFRLMHKKINEARIKIQTQKEADALKNDKDQKEIDTKELSNQLYTNSQIIRTLRKKGVTKVLNGYAGSFIRTELTDIMQSFLGEIRLDCQYIEPKTLRRGLINSKKRTIKNLELRIWRGEIATLFKGLKPLLHRNFLYFNCQTLELALYSLVTKTLNNKGIRIKKLSKISHISSFLLKIIFLK